MKIGFIGLGHMGNPMVRNLLKAKHAVTVYDVSESAINKAIENGANKAENIASLSENSDVIITMVQTSEQVAGICSLAGGIFNHAKTGTLYIDCSSIDIAMTRQLHSDATKVGIDMLDAPVSGGVAGAEVASLTFMVGG